MLKKTYEMLHELQRSRKKNEKERSPLAASALLERSDSCMAEYSMAQGSANAIDRRQRLSILRKFRFARSHHFSGRRQRIRWDFQTWRNPGTNRFLLYKPQEIVWLSLWNLDI
jgi:hypothetical protein